MPINYSIELTKGESYSQLHPSLQNIIFIMHEFESEYINYLECYDKVSQAIAIIQEYNAVTCKLNIEFWKIRTPKNISSFESVNIRQETSDQKNLISYTLSHPGITLMLIRKGLNPKNGLEDAIKYNYLESFSHLLDRILEDSDGDPLFSITLNQIMNKSVEFGTNQCVHILLKKIGKTTPQLSNQCLIQTIIKNKFEKFKLLIQYGINVQQENREQRSVWDGFSPLEIATLLKKPEYIMILVEKGAVVNENFYPSLLPDLIASMHIIKSKREFARLFNSALILIKFGLDLYKPHDIPENTFSQCRLILNKAIRKNDLCPESWKIIVMTSQLLADSILLTKSCQMHHLNKNEIEAINAIFFDLYRFRAYQDYYKLISSFFTIKNLKLLKEFLSSFNEKKLVELTKLVFGANLYFFPKIPKHPGGIDTPSPLSLIPKSQLDEHIKKRESTLKYCKRTIGNIEKIGEFIFRNHADYLFENICNYLDGSSLYNLSISASLLHS